MATSGSYNFTLNGGEMVTTAFKLINRIGLNETLESDDMNFGLMVLNAMAKVWQTDGIKLWKRRIGYTFTALNDSSYELGSPSGADHCTNSYVSTTLSGNEAAGQTVLSLISTSGITASDFIGIELDDGTRQWTTVVSVDSAVQLTVTTALTSAAASGNTIITYTSKLNRPLKLLRGTVLDITNNQEMQINPISYDDYYNLTNKQQPGTPNQFYYDRLLNNLPPYTGRLLLYPRPNNVNKIITFSYLDSLQDFDTSNDHADFPQEWSWPLVYNLAIELCPIYGKLQELSILQPKAEALKAMMNNFDADNEDLQINIE